VLKEKLGGEEGALESVSFEQLVGHLKTELDALPEDQMMFFDGFPYPIANLHKLVATLGEPKFIV
jgi:hypothetical protein